MKKRNRGGVSYLISFLSIYPPPLFLLGVMNPLCPICFTRHDVPCGLGLSSLRILIFNLSDFKIQLIVKKKKKFCQSNCDMPSVIRLIPISEMVKCEKQMCNIGSLKFKTHLA